MAGPAPVSRQIQQSNRIALLIHISSCRQEYSHRSILVVWHRRVRKAAESSLFLAGQQTKEPDSRQPRANILSTLP
jgi:hypothetical protein